MITDCDSCIRIATRDAGTAPSWDNVHRTSGWDVAHCYDTSLLGWTVLITRRHITSIDQLTADEAQQLGELLRNVSIVLKAELGCEKTYVMQFAEHPRHPHVHFHVVPRAADLPEEHLSTNIFTCLGVPAEQRVPDAQMVALGQAMGRYLR